MAMFWRDAQSNEHHRRSDSKQKHTEYVLVAFGSGFHYVCQSAISELTLLMLIDTLLFLAALYSIKIVIFGIAAFKATYPTDSSFQPTVSIIIAARNEEDCLKRCLESIVNLSYPVGLLEVIVVDDQSTDKTPDIVLDFAKRHNHIRLCVASPGTGNLRGKANAVAQGIDVSKGDILMFTDADCSVPAHWVGATVKYYTDPSIGIVAGFTALRSRGWFESIQALDWFVLFSVAAATIRLRYPVTAVGNNLSVRRAAYDEVGGYRTIPFSVTEDYALFHSITHQTTYRSRFPLDRATLVESEPCSNVRELFQQKKRWFAGGRGMDIQSMLVFLIPYGLNVALIVTLLCGSSVAPLVVFAVKTSVDFFLVLPSLIRFRRWHIARYFFVFEIYYITYVLLFPVIVLVGKSVVWKERRFGN
jgi:cellulose synthase/poly-beta-1,6-N-acetylglucosamine synthase-like glycosyltransferase